MANEVLGFVTTLSGVTTGAITGLRDVSYSSSVADVNISSNDDATGQFTLRFKAGMQDPGELAVNAVFKKATFDNAERDKRVEQVWTLTAADGSVLTFTGYIKTCDLGLPWEDVGTFDITIKVSGNVTFTPAV